MLLLQGIQKLQKIPKVLSPDSFLADSNLLIENDCDKDYIKSLIFNLGGGKAKKTLLIFLL